MKFLLVAILFIISSCGKELAEQQGSVLHASGTSHACHVSVSNLGKIACYNLILKVDVSDDIEKFCLTDIKNAEQSDLNATVSGYTVTTSYKTGNCDQTGINTSGYCRASLSELESRVFFYTQDNNLAQQSCNAIAQNSSYSWVSTSSGMRATQTTTSSSSKSYKEVKHSGGLADIIKSK